MSLSSQACHDSWEPERKRKPMVQRVNEKRVAEGRMLHPARVTPHTLRQTFASLCFFADRDRRAVVWTHE